MVHAATSYCNSLKNGTVFNECQKSLSD